jgi:hypothetical protein
MDIVSIAYGAVQILSPFLPSLLKLAKSAGEHIESFAVDKVTEQAEKLWNKITGRYKDDAVLNARATIVAASPKDEKSQRELSQALAERLAEDEAFAGEILAAIGGPKRLQEVIGGDTAIIERIRQDMEGPGVQRVQGGTGAHISDVSQIQKK